MEILAELLVPVLGWVAELVLQLVLEVLAGAGLRVLKEPWRPSREVTPWIAAPGYLLYGAAIGGFSLWLFPGRWLETPWARWAHLVLTPLAAGALMAALGRWRSRHGKPVSRIDHFTYGTLFALGLAAVRHAFAQAQ